MPSTTSRLVSIDFDSSTVMTPSLPTFSIASAMIVPIGPSPFAAIGATLAARPALRHRLGDDRADRLVAVRRDRADLGDRLALDGLADLPELVRHRGDRLLD